MASGAQRKLPTLGDRSGRRPRLTHKVRGARGYGINMVRGAQLIFVCPPQSGNGKFGKVVPTLPNKSQEECGRTGYDLNVIYYYLATRTDRSRDVSAASRKRVIDFGWINDRLSRGRLLWDDDMFGWEILSVTSLLSL